MTLFEKHDLPGVMERLRRAKLRPTIARIGVLQVIDAAAPGRLCADDVYRQLLLRGLRVSNGTVYRVIHQLEAAELLLREWSQTRTVYYRARPWRRSCHALRLVGHDGRSIELDDEDLRERLMATARREGLDFAGQGFTVHVESEAEVTSVTSRRIRAPAEVLVAAAHAG